MSATVDQAGVISGRKADHLRLCASAAVEFQKKSTLLEHVALIHEAMPECHIDGVNLATELLGKPLKAPLVISGMTGGTPEAEVLNRDLARVAEQHGIGFGLGSQRTMLLRPETAKTFAVRDVAPNVLLLANLGLVQARSMDTAAVARLIADVDADALCLHLNPAMELVQPGGDRDFRGGYAAIERLLRDLPVPLVIKETGCGLSRQTVLRLRDVGVRYIDVGGAGGTSWVGVEALRQEGYAAGLARELWDWGIPTAASVAANDDLGLDIIATGGLRCGADAAAALSLGARAAGFAAPVLRAHSRAGLDGASAFVGDVIESLRAHVFLVGCRAAHELHRCPKVLSPQLEAWIAAMRRLAPGRPRATTESQAT